MNTNYQVVLKGVGAGYLREDVAEKLAPLFKISIDEAVQMLDQHDLVVKKGVDFQAAVRYVEALEICGCFCEVQPEATHSTEAPAAAQPSPGSLNDRAERFDSVNETPVSESTKVEEENKWTGPTVSSRGKKFALYGLIGSVLVASVGYGAIAVYESREKRLVVEKENLVLEKLASIKPSTLDSVNLETEYPAEKSDILDWSKISAKSELLQKALEALQSKNDIALLSPELNEWLATAAFWGSCCDPDPLHAEAFTELHDLIEKYPGLALELAEASKRIISNQAHLAEPGSGWYGDPDGWQQLAINSGSKKTLDTYVETKKRDRDYASLYGLYSGVIGDIKDLPKAAEYFGLAVQSGGKQSLDVNSFEKITSNGPLVASAAREAILTAKPSANAGDKNELVKVCRDLSSDILDPLNGGKGVSYDEKPGVELEKCGAALLLDKNNKDLWYQYGYALQRNAHALQDRTEFFKAKIAYARAAQLGHSMAIARFWHLDYVGYIDPRKRAIKMLQAEAAAGNPWGSYFLGDVFKTSVKDQAGNDSLDYEKAEQAYLKAIDAGLAVAYVELGDVYFLQNKDEFGLKSWQKASDKFPRMSWSIGRMFETGDRVAVNMDMAKHWYKKAADQGIEAASEALARLGKEAAIARSDKDADSGQSSGKGEQSDLVDRCVKQALDTGYDDGQCAYSFINACVTTQSRSEMEKAFAIDRMVGMNSGGGCVNMPTNYVNAFNKVARNRDRF